MFNTDLADTSLASHFPDIAAGVDTFGDQLREALAPFIPAAHQARAFAALAALLEDDAAPAGAAVDREQIAIGILHAVYGDTRHEPDIRYIAAAALKRFGRDGRSYQAQGDEFGVTKACIQAHSRRIEGRTGIKCRSDKKDSARQKSAERARTRRRPAATAGVLQEVKTFAGRGIFAAFKLRLA